MRKGLRVGASFADRTKIKKWPFFMLHRRNYSAMIKRKLLPFCSFSLYFFSLFNSSSWVLSDPRSSLPGLYRIHVMKCGGVIISAGCRSCASPRRVAAASQVLQRPLQAEEPASRGRASAVVADAKPSHFKTNHTLRLQPPPAAAAAAASSLSAAQRPV